MTDLTTFSPSELASLKSSLEERYREFQSRQLSLDMTRGKPCSEQLDLSLDMLNLVTADSYKTMEGVDCRNYGGIDGIPEAKALFSSVLGVATEELLVCGNSSLNVMHDMVMRGLVHGFVDSELPWGKCDKITFLCPVPGYDRHFSICEYLNIKMIAVPLNEDGPDMDLVEQYVSEDDSIKGIWCVPKYSNPTGTTYSDRVVDRLSQMKTKSADFKIFWDNAYAVHTLGESIDSLKNILDACREAGNPERAFIFASTSKITFAGAGLSLFAASTKNIDFLRKRISFQMIGPDKLNQLRHVRFLKDKNNLEKLMQAHATILKPKFDTVLSVFDKELGDKNIATWSRPKGGYFINLDVLEACASKVVAKAAEAGVKLTPAGSTFPYKNDPNDCNIRIAPSFPSSKEVALATELLAVCIQLVSVEKLSK